MRYVSQAVFLYSCRKFSLAITKCTNTLSTEMTVRRLVIFKTFQTKKVQVISCIYVIPSVSTSVPHRPEDHHHIGAFYLYWGPCIFFIERTVNQTRENLPRDTKFNACVRACVRLSAHVFILMRNASVRSLKGISGSGSGEGRQYGGRLSRITCSSCSHHKN